jgi:3-oxoacyl-[acyl-carrier protein] reductase
VAALDIDFANWEFEPQEGLTIYRADLTSPRSIDLEVGHAIDEMGRCDSVVAAAAVVDSIHRAENYPDSDWDYECAVNLGGAFRLARAAFPALRDSRDGRIIFVSSVAAESGLPGQVAYATSKAGLVGLAKTLASEWAQHNIAVNVLLPGMIETPKVLSLPGALRARLTAQTSTGQFATTSEVAAAIAFFLSPAARNITGTTLRIDGGYLLNNVALSAREL